MEAREAEQAVDSTQGLEPAPYASGAAASPPPAVQGSSRLIRRQRWFLGITSGVALVAVGGLAASTLVKSPAQLAASQGAPAASILTSAVQDEVLTQQVVVRGTVVAGRSVSVTPAAELGATSLVVTGLPVTAGSTITSGEVLAQVSGRPLIALPGAVPVYRDLKPGDNGADVAQLQSALKSLGYTDEDSSGYFGTGTKDAVAKLYEHLGYDVPTTGGVGIGDAGDQSALQSAAAAVTSAERTVANDKTVLQAAQDATPRNATAVATDTSSLSYDEAALTTAQDNQATEIADTGVEMPMSEVVFLPAFPATLTAVDATVGSTVSSPLLTIDTGRLDVTATLQQSDASVLKQGMSVSILSETLNQSATGSVSYLGPYSAGAGGGAGGGSGAGSGGSSSGGGSGGAQSASGGTAAGYPLTVTPSTALSDAWLGQNVRLTINEASTSGKVLVVPVAAVSQAADGTVSVSVLEADDKQVVVPVTPGVEADGYVEVTPITAGALEAGDQVVTGQ